MVRLKSEPIANSSAASFVLVFKCFRGNDEEEFLENFKKIVGKYVENNSYNESLAASFEDFLSKGECFSVKTEGNKVFFSYTTSMFNSYSDIPEFITHIVLAKASGNIDKEFPFEYCELKSFTIEDES